MNTSTPQHLTTDPKIQAHVRELMLCEGWQVVVASPYSPFNDALIDYFAISANHKSPVHELPSPEWEGIMLKLAAMPKSVLLIEHEAPISINIQLRELIAAGHSHRDALLALLGAEKAEI